ncbi:stalk domain-containing protein [Paenibacillus filicis]|uniref:Stalk domain-containing protein n=1 Tax=Paenibacillus gyeongsangnamensis TaxID=3388067 RepID=A0ABT4QJE2_9BACL|nr:stalk domain-containing protein [Paenibacillus filicis]MCZ8516999.1 stalk domain-containing protein [Paenibacillus filicis]
MKKWFLGLAVLLFVNSSAISMAYADSAELLEQDPVVLPMKDDHGQNWVLKNQNAKYRLKWSFSSDSPYDHFDAMKVDNQTVILHNFSEVFAVSNNGQVLWKRQNKSRDIKIGADGSLYTFTDDFSYLDKNKTSSKITATRFNMNGTVLSQYKDLSLAIVRNTNSILPELFYTFDWKGNLIALLDNGLTSLRTDGTVKWQAKELKYNDTSYNVFAMNALLAYPQGNLLVGIDNQLLCLNDDGKVVWAIPTVLSKSGAKVTRNYVVFNGKIYTVTSTGLKEETDPDIVASLSGKTIDHHGGYFQVDGKTSTLSDIDAQSGKAKWSYTLSASERSAGYNLTGKFKQNLASDDQGNVYISTNGGTIHSLDPQGNPRFSLQITNKIIGYSQIIPLTKKTIIITNNRHAICLERVDDISLSLNGEEQSLQHQLFKQDGRVMISLREIFEMLEAKVTWIADQNEIIAEKNGKKIIMQLGSNEGTVNGIATIFDTAPVLLDNVTYVPIRFVSESLGSQVEWDDVNEIVRITDTTTNGSK